VLGLDPENGKIKAFTSITRTIPGDWDEVEAPMLVDLQKGWSHHQEPESIRPGCDLLGLERKHDQHQLRAGWPLRS